MNFCTNCGGKLDMATTRFCRSCGASTARKADGTAGPAGDSQRHENGGTEHPKHWASESIDPSAFTRPSSHPSRKHALFFIGIVASGLAIVAAVSIVLAQKDPVAAPPATQRPMHQSGGPNPTVSGSPGVGSTPTSDSGWGSNDPSTLGCQSSLPSGQQLALADTGESVRALQWGLATLKYETYNGSGQVLPTTGTYDQQTANAVERFQRNHQLPVTGSVDQATWLALHAQLHAWGSPPAC